jgi:hypothetical protein
VAIPVDVEVKLNRARHHIAALEAEIKPLAAACGKAVVRSQDSQTNEIIYRIDGLPTIDPMLSAIAGDAIITCDRVWITLQTRSFEQAATLRQPTRRSRF